MTRLAVLSAGPLGRIRGSGRAFAKARSLGVHTLASEPGKLGQAELEKAAGRLAAALRPALASTGEAAFAAICTPQLPSDSALAALGAALEAEGIGLGLSVTRFALADRLARGERAESSRTLLLDAYGDGVALFAAPNDATAVEGNLAETCDQRRTAVLRTFREVAEVDLNATAEALDAWLDAVQSSGELDSVANATWYLPDGTRVGVPADALERALDEVQSAWIAAVIEGCVEKAAENVDCLVVAGWLDALFHLGPRLRAALPHVRILVLDYEREAEMIHTWIDARERPRAGRVWVVERDFTAAPAQLSWSNGNAARTIEFVPETAPPVAETPRATEATAEAREPVPIGTARESAERRTPPPARPRPAVGAPTSSRAPLIAAIAVLALAQIVTISWIARSGRVRAAEGTVGRNDFSAAEAGALAPLAELRADVDELRTQFEGDGRDVNAYRFQIEELESELTKLRYAFDAAPSSEDFETLRTDLGEVRTLANEASSGTERTRLTETVAQLALDVQDLQRSEVALAQLTRDMAELRADGGLRNDAATGTDPGGAASIDGERVDRIETALANLGDTARRIETEGADARGRLEFLEATFEELDLNSSLETLTSTGNLLMERIARNEEALATRAPQAGEGGVSSSTASLLLDRCETIEQTLRNLRGDVERIDKELATTTVVDTGRSDPGPIAAPSEDLVARILANEAAIAAVRSELQSALPETAGVELAPSTMYPELAARRMRVFNAAGSRVVHTSYDEEGHGALRLYGADGSRQVLAGSSKGGDAGFLGTFDRDGNELFMVTTLAENGAGHLSLMDGAGERRISMTTDSDGDGVLWIRDSRGRTVEVLGGGGDLAETVRPAPGHTLMPGQVVRVVDSDEFGPRVAPCVDEYDTSVLGIVSAAGSLEPAMTFGRTGAPGEQAVALAGQVYCLVDAGPHAIRAGDLLVSSGRMGHARWADPECTPPGSIVGKALETLADGTGLIRVWVQGR